MEVVLGAKIITFWTTKASAPGSQTAAGDSTLMRGFAANVLKDSLLWMESVTSAI